MSSAVTGHPATPGRNTIASRAVRSVVSAVTAEQLGVSASRVAVALSDRGGALDVVAKTPIRILPLDGESGRATTIVDRLTVAQESIRDRCLSLTGSAIARVDLHITGAQLEKPRRVT